VTARPWSLLEVDALRRYAPLGPVEVGRMLNRSPEAVKQAAKKHRVSLRRPGSRMGLVLGQPRGVSASSDPRLAAYRDDVLAGTVDATSLERQVQQAAHGTDDLCPLCAQRPRERLHGICRVCHLRELERAHRAALDAQQAARDLAAARQAKHRAAS